MAVAANEPVSPALKGFIINLIRETMYDAGYTSPDIAKQVAEKSKYIDTLSAGEVTLELLETMSDAAFHVEP